VRRLVTLESTKMAYVAAEEAGLRNPVLVTEVRLGAGVVRWTFEVDY
jgi:hypothetical protein